MRKRNKKSSETLTGSVVPELFMFFVTEEQIDNLPAGLGSSIVRSVIGEDVWLVACLRRAWREPIHVCMYDLANPDAQWLLEHLQGQDSIRDAIKDTGGQVIVTSDWEDE